MGLDCVDAAAEETAGPSSHDRLARGGQRALVHAAQRLPVPPIAKGLSATFNRAALLLRLREHGARQRIGHIPMLAMLASVRNVIPWLR